MNTTSFSFKSRTAYWPLLATGFLFLGFSLFLLTKLFAHGTTVRQYPIAIVLSFLVGVFGILLLISCLHRIRYVRIDKNKTLLLDKTNSQLQIDCNYKTYTITNTDIKNVEVYNSWNSKAILPGYMKINLSYGGFYIITGFLADEFDLDTLLKSKKRVMKTRWMNSISKNDIKGCIC